MPSPVHGRDLRRLLDVLADTHRVLLSVPPFDTFELFEALYAACRQLAPVDAFYVCLYSPDEEALHFPFHFDMGVFDQPVVLRLGDGPTSRAITTGKVVRITADDRSAHDAGIPFGDMNRTSRAALHVPMRACAGLNPTMVVGVLSIQSYEIDAYEAAAIPVLEMLADRAGALLWSWREQQAAETRLAGSEQSCEEFQRTAARLQERYAEAMARIGREAETIVSTLDKGQLELWRSLDRLRKTAYRAQAELAQAEFGISPAGSEVLSTSPAADPASPAVVLTDREAEVLNLLTLGESNREIADTLRISVDTVKFHCKNLYAKFGAASRRGAVRAAANAGMISIPDAAHPRQASRNRWQGPRLNGPE